MDKKRRKNNTARNIKLLNYLALKLYVIPTFSHQGLLLIRTPLHFQTRYYC